MKLIALAALVVIAAPVFAKDAFDLPKLLTANDGTPVKTDDDWENKRRAEITDTLKSV